MVVHKYYIPHDDFLCEIVYVLYSYAFAAKSAMLSRVYAFGNAICCEKSTRGQRLLAQQKKKLQRAAALVSVSSRNEYSTHRHICDECDIH